MTLLIIIPLLASTSGNVEEKATSSSNTNTSSNKAALSELSKIQTNFSKENIKKELDNQYTQKIKHLKSKFEVSVQDLVKVKVFLENNIKDNQKFPNDRKGI